MRHLNLLKTKIKFELIKKYICCFLFFLSTTVIAQDTINHKFKFGFEYDLMAPRIGAWNSVNINGYIGKGYLKHSLIFAYINISKNHLTDESFTKDNLNAFGYRFEIFSRKEMRRWSTGLILICSMHDVTTVTNNQDGHFNTFIIGVPLGYSWLLWDHLTINPNISV